MWSCLILAFGHLAVLNTSWTAIFAVFKKRYVHKYSYYLMYLAMFEPTSLNDNENTFWVLRSLNLIPFVFFCFPNINTNPVALACQMMSFLKSENKDKASSLKVYLTSARHKINANKASVHSKKSRIIKWALNKNNTIAEAIYERALSGLLIRVKLQVIAIFIRCFTCLSLLLRKSILGVLTVSLSQWGLKHCHHDCHTDRMRKVFQTWKCLRRIYQPLTVTKCISMTSRHWRENLDQVLGSSSRLGNKALRTDCPIVVYAAWEPLIGNTSQLFWLDIFSLECSGNTAPKRTELPGVSWRNFSIQKTSGTDLSLVLLTSRSHSAAQQESDEGHGESWGRMR